MNIEYNNCRCHQETCCCDEYMVMMPYGDKLTFFDRQQAERFVAWVKEGNRDQNRSS